LENTDELKSNGKFAVKGESKKPILGFVAIAAVFLVIGVLAGGFFVPQAGLVSLPTASGNALDSGNSAAVAEKTMKYLNDNFFSRQGAEAKLSSIKEEFGMYNVAFDVYKETVLQGSMNVYVSKDGKDALVASQVLELDTPVPEQPVQPAEELKCEDVTKASLAEAKMEAFIVSNCPFGLQAQRVLAPVAKLLGNNIVVRYIGSVENGKVISMHGEAEATENLRQICIREEQKDLYWPYVECYIKEGNTDACLVEAKVDKTGLDSCMADPLKGVKYAQEDFDLATKYAVGGSPTLVLNGVSASEFAFATAKGIDSANARSPDNFKNLLCCGISDQPDSCNTKLAEEGVATGFSTTGAGTGSGGSCS
jgi:protein-disulfide isomerase